MTDRAAEIAARAGVSAEPAENPIPARLAELRAALVRSSQLESISDPVPVLDGILYRDSLAWLFGKPGGAKSFVALDWAGCIANGMPWHGHTTTKGRVLYIVAEGVSGIRKRVRAWEEAFRVPMGDVTFLPMAVQLLRSEDLSALIELIKELGPILVVIDTQARVTVGADENSNGQMGEVVNAADKIRRACGACILLVHHSGKNGLDLRGASAIEGAATSVIKVVKEGDRVYVYSEKQKDVEDFPKISLCLRDVGASAVLHSSNAFDPAHVNMTEAADSERAVLDAMRDTFGTTSATTAQLIEVTGLPKSTVYWAVNSLHARGAVRNIGTKARQKWALPDGTQGTLIPETSNDSNGVQLD
ncbi:AAA family ATPase [Streptomyces ureilyticus]|uniref:AAA family ATPase n=1 Tax=Streptomyces ureilyticus TaxID=1775131 RepID=A0ABX0E9D6_9ACTN|nr:AAA family ATPase [Streptomyces ureilyticus]NGO48302.1 AAA family ATPase [Streptomyces ureilyticus]